MDRRVLLKTNPQWAESKVILLLGIFSTWALTDDVYDALIKGCPFHLHHLDDGPVMTIIWVMGVCWLLFASLTTIRDHGRRVYLLKPFPLLVQIFWAGSMMLYLVVMSAFLLDFFLTNAFTFE